MTERTLVRVVPVCREGARWVMRLSGIVNTTLEYDGRRVGREVVRLGEEVVAQASTFGGYNRRFELEAATPQGPVPLVLEVRVSLWSAIESVTVCLGGRTVYYEHTYRAAEPVRLSFPVPVELSDQPHEALPRPLPVMPLDAACLPRVPAELPVPGAATDAERSDLVRVRRRTRTIAALLALAGGFLG